MLKGLTRLPGGLRGILLHSTNRWSNARLPIDSYRLQVLDTLTSCADSDIARALLVEVDERLNARGLSTRAQRAFWEALDTDLDVAGEESAQRLGRQAPLTLSAIIATSRIDIKQYLSLVYS